MALFMPRLTKCCSCIPLRIGALIIGYFSLILSILFISVVCGSLYEIVKYVREHENDPASGYTTEEIRSAGIRLYIAHAFFILVFLFSCATNLMLIIGVHWNNLRLVGYYLTTSMVLLVLELILMVLTFLFLGLIAALPLLTWNIIVFSFIIVVRSTYLEMEDLQKPLISMIFDTNYQSNRRRGSMQQPLIYEI